MVVLAFSEMIMGAELKMLFHHLLDILTVKWPSSGVIRFLSTVIARAESESAVAVETP
jgi:hypothetical protein